MFCEGLKNILHKRADIHNIKLFYNGQSVLKALELEQPNLILGDISMQEMNGIELLKIVKSKFPLIKYILISTFNSTGYVKDVMKEGANGYITKDSESTEIIEAIKMVMDGNIYISPSLSGKLFKTEYILTKLTKREIEVLEKISLGFTSQQISEKLFISFHTVESHRKSLLAKTECQNSVELSIWGIENGIIQRGSH